MTLTTAAPRRFLLVTLDAAGNWPPERALVRALLARGHAVRVLSHASHAHVVRAAGARFEQYDPSLDVDLSSAPGETATAERMRVARAVYFNRGYGAALQRAVETETPDVLLVDQMLLMASHAAERTGLPTVVLWHTVFAALAGQLAFPSPGPADILNAYRATLGLEPLPADAIGMGRADAILAFTWEALDAPARPPLPVPHYIGPLASTTDTTDAAPPAFALPWAAEDARPLVLVSFSTSFQNQVATLQRVADAVAGLPARVLVTLGPAVTAEALRLPANAVALPFVPHAAVLPHARLVVTHAGHGTVMAAVTAGVPLVCLPMGRDQHAVAECVRSRGLGRVLAPTAPTHELRDAIAAALADAPLAAECRRFATTLDVEAGRRRALALLEQVGTAAR
ncbi:MAG: glycosyltransferase family 1 protein [bacterium]|nr:glycosyltransferase family 1 protein [bacterium]